MKVIFEGPRWKFSALLRVVPFILFLITVFGVLSGNNLDNRALLLLGVLAVASLGAWFILIPKSHNGR